MEAELLTGADRDEARITITKCHYAHSVSAGKSYYFSLGEALVVYSIPANRNIGPYLLGCSDWPVWELSRLWAPDGHAPNLLTQAIAETARALREVENVVALVSYADPNVGHDGAVYRAASWVYLGQCEESRYYRLGNQVVSRRKFHSGPHGMRKADILALGYTQLSLPGKHRYAKGLTKPARKAIERRAG